MDEISTFETEKLEAWTEKTRQNAAKNLESLVSNGTLIEADELVNQLGWTRQALSKARKTRRVFSVEIKGETYYPAFFADPQYERRQRVAGRVGIAHHQNSRCLSMTYIPKSHWYIRSIRDQCQRPMMVFTERGSPQFRWAVPTLHAA